MLQPHPRAPKLLGARCDGLSLAWGGTVRADRLQELQRRSGPMMLAGHTFAIEARGSRGKPFAAEGPVGRLAVGEREVLIEVAVEHLVARGLGGAVEDATGIAAALVDVVERAEVRAIDLCADIEHGTMVEGDRAAFVSRFRRLRTWTEGTRGRMTGLHFGSRNGLLLCAYDKAGELSTRRDGRAELEHDTWRRAGWDGVAPVWRYELRVRGRALSELGLREPESVTEKVDGVWVRVLGKELRLVELESATRRERAALDPRWTVALGAVFVGAAREPAVRVRSRSGVSLPQALGGLASFLAVDGVPLEVAHDAVEGLLRAIGREDESRAAKERVSAAFSRIRGQA